MKARSLLKFIPALLVICSGSQAQNEPQLECPSSAVMLPTSDPVYDDVIELTHKLENYGFAVKCVFTTKFESVFRIAEVNGNDLTVLGEANLRTNYGDVDVVFLPKGQTFAGFKVTENPVSGGYSYTWAGTPRAPGWRKLESPQRIYFLKDSNHLFLVKGDTLRARVEAALQARLNPFPHPLYFQETDPPLPFPSPTKSQAPGPVEHEAPGEPYPKANTGGYGSPACLYCPQPQYNDEAIQATHQGIVLLTAVITTEGRAINIRVLKSLDSKLDERAVEAVSKWHFRPALGPDNKPAAVRQEIQATFHLP